MDQNTETQVISAVKTLFEWTFQVQIPAPVMGWVGQQLRACWEDGDQSEQQLVAYLVQLTVALLGTPEPNRTATRPQLQAALLQEFSQLNLNDRGRVLTTMRGILETLRPGCTHAPATLAASVGQAPGAGLQRSAGGPLPTMESLLRGGPGGAPAPGAGGQMPGVNDMLDTQANAQRNQQLMMMRSNMQKMHHDTMMSIINNLRV